MCVCNLFLAAASPSVLKGAATVDCVAATEEERTLLEEVLWVINIMVDTVLAPMA